MISKEERAELRELVASVTLPLHDFVADCDGTGGDFIDAKPAKLIAAAISASPRLLDALDAADERIAGLEAELDKLKGRNCDDANHGLTLDHRCVACSHIENCEERIAQLESWGREDCEPLKARIAELEAAAQSAIFALHPTWAQDPASLPATLGRAIAAHQESLQALAKGCDYVASQTDGYDRCVADPMVALGLLAVVETDEDGDPTYKRVRPAPIPALPEGGV